MASRYKAADTPIEGPEVRSQRIRVQDFIDITKPYRLSVSILFLTTSPSTIHSILALSFGDSTSAFPLSFCRIML